MSPLTIDFGVAPVDSPTTADLTLTNEGGGTITLLSVTLTNGDPDVFSVDRAAVQTITAGQSGIITVIIEPEEQGRQYTGALQVRTDAAIEPSVSVTLRGVGGLSAEDADGDGFSAAQGDCDDDNDQVYPGATEICDGIDNDCDDELLADELDEDDDDWLVCEGDCDDFDDEVNPGMDEICDEANKDNDCDPLTAERNDVDNDGFTLCDGDCDDNEPRATPNGIEVCDGVDNDCDGGTDDIDADNDGVSVCTPQGPCDPDDVTQACDCDDNDPNAFPVVVSPNGSNKGAGTDADPFETIPFALANLDDVCRRVVLQPGTYPDIGVTIDGETVTLAGQSGNPTDVILEAAADTPHVTVTGFANVALANLTLTGGDVPLDGGAVQVTTADLTLSNVVAEDNRSAADGGAIAVTSGSLTIGPGCAFIDNEAGDDAGAITLAGSVLRDDEGTLYQGNVAAAQGGAIRAEAPAELTIVGALFDDNTGAEGGAIYLTGATPAATIEGNRFWRNDATTAGGAIATRGFVPTAGAMNRNRFQDNTALGEGGALVVLGGKADPSGFAFHNNTLTGNQAIGFEGAAIAVLAPANADLLITSNMMLANDGESALYVAPGSTAVVDYNTAFLTNTLVHFAGAIVDGNGEPLDETNLVEDPGIVFFNDDANPGNDNLVPDSGSPLLDSGNPAPQWNDALDNTRNDRGYTGGPSVQ
ncbi:MAG: MopE-related protein [Myxococcota bacterium]